MKDGGPAFPHVFMIPAGSNAADGTVKEIDRQYVVGGMSLRDYFAAHNGPSLNLYVFAAADGKIELLDPSSVSQESLQRLAEQKAAMSYLIADAMLRAREKGTPE